MQHSLGASFVLRLELGLAPEKRAACHPPVPDPQPRQQRPASADPDKKGVDADLRQDERGGFDQSNQHKPKPMVNPAQPDKF
ncbi:hypothetical protein PR003_g31540 [Phytophthora rubi]|uniref:Uncharacterized protein n=1 Tax=Phytophthora rubi TaxID=129364 RepID=A0A6A3GU64_9STRA|nr:hypothetical protein PR002_g30212 [Phytophthora rubi]KAE9268161.1 hypothetical protein PR003_g31540 [Phytophthora rubi]